MQAEDMMIMLKESRINTKNGEKAVFKGDVLIGGMPDLKVIGWVNQSDRGGYFFYLNEDLSQEERGYRKPKEITPKPFNINRKKNTGDWFASSMHVQYAGLVIPMIGDIDGVKPNREICVTFNPDLEYGQSKGITYQTSSNYVMTDRDEQAVQADLYEDDGEDFL